VLIINKEGKMDIKELFLNDELVVGEKCYYDHNEYTYQGINEDGKYIVNQKTKDSEVTKYLQEKPVRAKLPTGIYLKDDKYSKVGELTKCFHMLGKMYYEITLYDDVFKGHTNETLDNILNNWQLIENPYVDENSIYEILEEIEGKLYPYKNQIKELEKQINIIKEEYMEPIEKEKEGIYKICKHKWDKDEEEEISKNSFQQRCECEICGCVKYNSYSKLF